MKEQARPIVVIDDGRTKLWGFNVGRHPLHSFFCRPSSDASSERLPLRLSCTGWDEWVEGCERRRRNSCVFAVEYVKEGSFEFFQDGVSHASSPGDVFLVKLGHDNAMSAATPQARKRTMIVEGPCLETALNACGLGSVDFLQGAGSEALDELFDRAETLFRDAPPGFQRQASAAVYETFVLLGEASRGRTLPEPLKKALALFESRLASKVSLPELAARCACSQVTLQRLFRKHLGETPLERFIGMKIELAKELLKLSSEPVKEISRRLGYSSQLYFSTEFKKRAGVSPKAWRKGSGS